MASVQRPVLNDAPTTLTVDGTGRDVLPRHLTLWIIQQHNLAGLLLPSNMTAVYSGEVRMLRSMFSFRFLCCTTQDPSSYRLPVIGQLTDDWAEFYANTLSLALTNVLGKSALLDVQVYGSGVSGPALDSCSATDPFLPDAMVFDASDQLPPVTVTVCSEGGFLRAAPGGACPLVWCEASSAASTPRRAGECSCFRRPQAGCGAAASADVRLQLVAPRHFSAGQLAGRIGDIMSKWAPVQGLQVDSGTKWNVSHLLVPMALNSKAGLMAGLVTEVNSTLRRLDATASCGWTDACFCGVDECQLHRLSTWLRIQPLHLDNVSYSRTALPEDKLEYIHVFWGLNYYDLAGVQAMASGRPRSSLQGHSFRSSFLPHLPQAQRDLYRFCNNLPKDLLVKRKMCWVDDFRDWLKSRGRRYPVPLPGFHDSALDFFRSGVTGPSSSGDFVWVTNGTVRAFFATFAVSVSRCLSGSSIDAFKLKWDAYVHAWNLRAQAGATGAWHTSRLWWSKFQFQSKQFVLPEQPLHASAISSAFGTAVPARTAVALAWVGALGAARLPRPHR